MLVPDIDSDFSGFGNPLIESQLMTDGCLIPVLWSSSSEPLVSAGTMVVCEVVTGGLPDRFMIVPFGFGLPVY